MVWWNKEETKSSLSEWTFSNDDFCITDGKCPEMERKPKIVLSLRAQSQIKTLCRKYPDLEWMAALIGKETIKDEWYVENLQLFEQKVKGAFVELTDEGNVEMNKVPNIGWIHSHNNMSTFFSGQDISTASHHTLSIVVNNKGEFSAKARIKVTCSGGKFALLDASVYLTIETDKETEELADKLIIYEPNVVTKEISHSIDITDNMCRFCNDVVGRHNKRQVGKFLVHKKCYDDYLSLEEQDMVCNDCGFAIGYCDCGTFDEFLDAMSVTKKKDDYYTNKNYDNNGYCFGCGMYFSICSCNSRTTIDEVLD